MHPSPYHGFSVEFAEHREYVPGDDIRHVDWKVWSKTDKFYLKQYEEETNLLLYLLLDTSESMAYASGENVSKLQYAQFVAAALALHGAPAAGLGRPGDRSTTRSAATSSRRPAVAPEGAAPRDGRHPGAREVGPRARSSTTWPSGSRSGAWWRSSPTCSTTSPGSSPA